MNAVSFVRKLKVKRELPFRRVETSFGEEAQADYVSIEITVAKGFDGTTLSEVLNLLKARSCSASAAR